MEYGYLAIRTVNNVIEVLNKMIISTSYRNLHYYNLLLNIIN